MHWKKFLRKNEFCWWKKKKMQMKKKWIWSLLFWYSGLAFRLDPIRFIEYFGIHVKQNTTKCHYYSFQFDVHIDSYDSYTVYITRIAHRLFCMYFQLYCRAKFQVNRFVVLLCVVVLRLLFASCVFFLACSN